MVGTAIPAGNATRRVKSVSHHEKKGTDKKVDKKTSKR
jgi:hypothetical protein